MKLRADGRPRLVGGRRPRLRLAELPVRAVRQAADLPRRACGDARLLRGVRGARPGRCLVAEDEETGRLMGSCYYRARETNCSLGIMNVHPVYWGTGVGKALLDWIVDFANGEGKPLRLVSSAMNLDSFSLYTRGALSRRSPTRISTCRCRRRGSPLCPARRRSGPRRPTTWTGCATSSSRSAASAGPRPTATSSRTPPASGTSRCSKETAASTAGSYLAATRA